MISVLLDYFAKKVTRTGFYDKRYVFWYKNLTIDETLSKLHRGETRACAT